MGFNWQTAPSVTLEQLGQEWAARAHAVAFQLLQSYAPQVETWMKQNASWTDRTGNARQSLWAETFDFIHTIVLAYGHGMDYGQYLEFSNGGSFSIISPATDYFLPKIRQDIQRIFS